IVPLTPSSPVLSCGDHGPGSLRDIGQVDLFAFDATAGDIRFLTFVATTSFAITGQTPHAVVLSPTGVTVLSFAARVQQQLAMPETGRYVVTVQASGLTATGAFVLGMDCLVPVDPRTPALTCNVATDDVIDTNIKGDVDLFTFTGEAGDVWGITLAAR